LRNREIQGAAIAAIGQAIESSWKNPVMQSGRSFAIWENVFGPALASREILPSLQLERVFS
jgi:hypothetical protein